MISRRFWKTTCGVAAPPGAPYFTRWSGSDQGQSTRPSKGWG